MFLITSLAFFMTAATPVPPDSAQTGSVQSPAPAVDLAVGYTVTNRRLDPMERENIFQEGETVIAWTAVSGLASSTVEHVWLRNGVEVARHSMPVGSAHRWRTWSRHHVTVGKYEVRVIGPDGQELAKTTFTVEPAEGC